MHDTKTFEAQSNVVIVHDSKQGKLVDKSRDILSIKVSSSQQNTIDILFNSSNRVFSYNQKNIKWIDKYERIDLKDKLVVIKGSLVFSIIKILQFQDWYKVFYENGKNTTYHQNEISIKKTMGSNPKVKNLVDYLIRVASFE